VHGVGAKAIQVKDQQGVSFFAFDYPTTSKPKGRKNLLFFADDATTTKQAYMKV
jgi:hypothetical protein